MTDVPLDDLTDFAGFCDPASGKQVVVKKARARSAIVVVAQDALTRVYVLLAWADRVPTPKLVEKILDTVTKYPRVRRFGIEANAMQSLFADLVIRDAKRIQQRVALLPVQQPTRLDKDFRIRTVLQPVIADGRLLIQAGQRELRIELESFPNVMTKDLVDALASAIRLLPRRAMPQAKREEAVKLAAYLRETGAPASYIEQEMMKLGLPI